MRETRERAEIACGLLWFILDGCWMMEWPIACYIAGVGAVFWTGRIIALTERDPVSRWVCAADTAWITFNILWAVGDLASLPAATTAAKALFFVGGGCYSVAVMCADNERQIILGPLRFLASLVRR